MTATVLLERTERVATLTINRPEKLNALSGVVIEELSQAFDALAADEQIRAVVLTGAGSKAFVAGADIAELSELSAIDALHYGRRGQALMMKLERFEKPVIAAVNGYALGGGFELALACGLRYAAESAQFGLPEINLGLMPGYGGTQRLARLCGAGRALELTLVGDRISAKQALDWGVVNRVVPDNELLEVALRTATALAAKPPLAVRAIIDAIRRVAQFPTDQGCEHEAQAFALLCTTADKAEGTRAFLEKRQAQFSGR